MAAGTYALHIRSIRVIQDGSRLNFEKIIQSITVCDQIISGTFGLEKIDSLDFYHVVLRTLFDHALGRDSSDVDLNKYVIDTFESFVENKTSVWIDLERLNKNVAHDKLLDLFLNERSVTNYWKPKIFNIRDDADYSNLINPVMLKVFKNVTELSIDTAAIIKDSMYDYVCYSMSIIALLSVIKDTNLQRVIIRTSVVTLSTYGESYTSWIEMLWNACSDDIIEKYKDEQYQISFEQKKDSSENTLGVRNHFIDKIIIQKI